MRLTYVLGLTLVATMQVLSANCEGYLSHMERAMGIPPHLLKAISHIESGRQVKGVRVAWPWTINVGGRGYIFPAKQEAIEAVKRFQKQGLQSIDVGCMQVNLKYHPHAFRSLEDAFDPQLNITYAAQYLKDLKARYGSWVKAVAHYHSALPYHHGPYQKRVMQEWDGLKRFPNRKEEDLMQVAPLPLDDDHEVAGTTSNLVRFTPYTECNEARDKPTALPSEPTFTPLAHRVGDQPTAQVKRHYVQLFASRDTTPTIDFS